MAYYADTSALVKLVVAESESAALTAWIARSTPTLVTSDLTRTELIRAVRRSAPHLAIDARGIIDSVTVLTIRAATFESAARLDPVLLRSLDALHLASALELGDDLTAIVTYDDRLADAALAQGIRAIAPR